MPSRFIVALPVVLVACTTPMGVIDGGPTDAPAEAAVGPCTRDLECEDGLYCTVHRCRPGEGDARGCVEVGTACELGETCSEAERRCDAVDCTEPDRDGDGHGSNACGEDDCDDDDANRFPGNPEVCDDGGHDEDCLPDTFAGVDADADGDGEVSGECCNAESCGPDCDDTVAAVNTSASETCNGVDDDCSGAVDDGTGPVPLCPGGACMSGRCSFTSWDRVLGDGGNDLAKAVAADRAGNVYVSGAFLDGSDFGSGDVDNALVVSYTADGVLRWVLTYDAAETYHSTSGVDLAHDPADDGLYLLGGGSSVTLGSVTLGAGGFLARLDTGGAVEWVVELPNPLAGARGGSVAVHDGRVFVASSLSQPFDFGDGTARAPAGSRDGYIAEYDAAGALVRVRTYGAAGAITDLVGIAADGGGNLYAAGGYTGRVDFGDGARTAMMRAVAIVSLAADGTHRWARVFDSPAVDGAEAVAVGREAVFVGGNVGGNVDLGGGPIGAGGFLLALELDGMYRWRRSLAGSPASTDGSATPLDVTAHEDDRVWVVGRFGGAVDFGNGALASEGETDAFVALYGPDALHLRDRALGEGGAQDAWAVALGPGDALTLVGAFSGAISFDSGRRTVPAGQAGFVARVLY